MRTSALIAIAAVALIGWGGLSPAGRAAEQATDDEWQGLPPGPGREEVFYACQACHSLALVKQQGLSKAAWDETITWMIEEQEMEPPEPEERALIVQYLATHYGIDRKRHR